MLMPTALRDMLSMPPHFGSFVFLLLPLRALSLLMLLFRYCYNATALLFQPPLLLPPP